MNYRRVAVVATAGLLPWVVVTWDGGWYPLFSAGFLHFDPLSFTSLPAYHDRVGAFPPRFSAWPTAALLWAAALASALLDDPDPRVTAGLLFLAGVSVATLAVSLSDQRTVLAAPVGAVWLWVAVWVGYGRALLPGAD